MRNLLLILFIFTSASGIERDEKITIRGIVLVHYNAEFNSSNNYTDIVKIRDAKVMRSWIDKNPDIKKTEGIRSVPTLILYNNGKEIKRWEAGIDLKLKVPLIEVQKEIDNVSGVNKF